jgi:ABC-type uncharacterized transport system permease subunit
MSHDRMTTWILLAGVTQASILTASALVPTTLRWRQELAPLPRLHRQMHWVYGGYVVLSIVAFAAISLLAAEELASGSRLARAVCAYIAVFWGVRLCLQAVFAMRPYLTTWWKAAGYAVLTIAFAGLTAIYAIAAVWTPY